MSVHWEADAHGRASRICTRRAIEAGGEHDQACNGLWHARCLPLQHLFAPYKAINLSIKLYEGCTRHGSIRTQLDPSMRYSDFSRLGPMKSTVLCYCLLKMMSLLQDFGVHVICSKSMHIPVCTSFAVILSIAAVVTCFFGLHNHARRLLLHPPPNARVFADNSTQLKSESVWPDLSSRSDCNA